MLKATTLDRVYVSAAVAVLTVWAASLVVLWTIVFDSSGVSLPIGAASTLLAVGLAARLPSWLLTAARRTWGILSRDETASAELALSSVSVSAREDVRGAMRLLSVSMVLSAIGGAASSLLLLVAGPLVEAALASVLWSNGSWLLLRLVVQVVATLPLAFGVAVVFLAGSVLRAGKSHDAYADLARDALIGVAAGLAVFGVLWAVGANFIGAIVICLVVLIVLAAGLLLRRDLSRRPGRLVQPIETPTEFRRLALEVTCGGLTLGLCAQGRILADLSPGGVAVRSLWFGLSLALLAGLLAKVDSRGRLPGRQQQAGCQIGLLSTVLLQAIVAGLCLLSLQAMLTLWWLAAAAQVPLAAMAAILLARQRMLFVNAGGRPRGFLAAVGIGGGFGILLWLVITSAPHAQLVVPAAALILIAAGFARMLMDARRRDELLRWSLVGLVVVASLTAGTIAAADAVRDRLGRLVVGRWQTRRTIPGEAQTALLGREDEWTSGEISRLLRETMAATSGRWWIVLDGTAAKAAVIPDDLQIVAGACDLRSLPEGSWKQSLSPGPHRSWISGAIRGRGRFDGIFVDCLPADHEESWRVYNLTTLRGAAAQLRFADRQARPLVIRTQARGHHMRHVLGVARTLLEAVGSGWMAVQFYDDRADVLLAGPAETMPAPREGDGFFVVPLGELTRQYPAVGPVRLSEPAALWGTGITVPQVAGWLKQRGLQGR